MSPPARLGTASGLRNPHRREVGLLIPSEARAGWNVFISYRSLNRSWVLALYDALTQAGFKVFLDQFALVPGASLVISLQTALQQSANGVIV